MRLFANGKAIHGLLTLCLDKTEVFNPPIRSTAPSIISDLDGKQMAVYQVERNGKWSIELCNVLGDKGTSRLDASGANHIEGGGQVVWAAWGSIAHITDPVTGKPYPAGTTGIHSNKHPTLPGAGLWGVGNDGCLGYSASRSSNKGIIFRSLDGQTLTVSVNDVVRDVHIVNYGTAAYTVGGKLRVVVNGVQQTVNTVDEPLGQPRLIYTLQGWWVLYHTQDRLLLQPIGAAVGYVLETRPITFNPDAVALNTDVIRAAWSTTQGEGAAAFEFKDTNIRTDPRVPLAKPQVIQVAPFDTAFLHGYFFADSVREGSTPEAPGSCTVIVESGLTTAKRVILGDTTDTGKSLIDEWASRWSQVDALYIASEQNRSLLEDKVDAAHSKMINLGLPNRPVITYTGGTITVVGGTNWAAFQCYPEPGQTTTSAKAAWSAQLDKAPSGVPIVLITGDFDRRKGNGVPLIDGPTLLAFQPVYVEIARAIGPRLRAWLHFAYNRQGGVRDYPQLLPWHKAIDAAVKVPPVPVNTGKPKIVADQPVLAGNGEWDWTTRDSLGQTIRTWAQRELGGGLYIYQSILNSAGKDTTSAKRRIG